LWKARKMKQGVAKIQAETREKERKRGEKTEKGGINLKFKIQVDRDRDLGGRRGKSLFFYP